MTQQKMSIETAKGIVETLEALSFRGITYVLGYTVERTAKNNAVWVVFRSIMTGNDHAFQYTPGGQWENLIYINGELHKA
ncbi:MAG: hypothetical protein WBB28_01435 [Crinalium sp.]